MPRLPAKKSFVRELCGRCPGWRGQSSSVAVRSRRALNYWPQFLHLFGVVGAGGEVLACGHAVARFLVVG